MQDNRTASRSRRGWRTATITLAALTLLVGLTATGCKDNDDDPEDTGMQVADAAPDSADGGDDGGADTADGTDDADAGSGYDLELPGLSAPVKVQYDDSGVLHLDCQTNADCYIAQGYFHADDRFFEMDLVRRQTRGQLAEIVNDGSLLESDKTFRQLMTTREGEPLEEAYVDQVDEETLAMMEAYAKGVNAWLDDMRNEENGATLTEEYEFPLVRTDNVRDWEPEDTVALYLQLAYQLSLSSDGDIFRGEMMGKRGLSRADGETLDSQVAADLLTVKPGLESNTIQASGAMTTMSGTAADGRPFPTKAVRQAQKRLMPAVDALGQARRKLEASPSLLFGPKTGEDGSNNWALNGSRTKNGQPLLANDPHLSLNNPAIWYYIEMDSKTNGNGDLHVAGASIPCVPGIVVGQNEHIAWGVTTARLDLADAYVETLNDDGTAVMRNGNEVDLITRDYTFTDYNDNEETVTFEWVPEHGPILSKDMENNRAISIKWVAQKAGNDIDFIDDLMTAENVDEAMSAVEPIRTINQNWLFMDSDGDMSNGEIGWYPKGAIPKRPWASSDTPNWLPLPGDGSAEWQGTLEAANAPKMTDPPNGFIATANNDFDGSYTDGDATNDGHTPWQAPPAYGHRHKRIVERIEEGGNDHTPETMHDIQADTFSLHGETLVPEIIDIADENIGDLSSGATEVLEALRAWQYTCPTGLDSTDPEMAEKVSGDEAVESIGCSAFHVMLPALADAVFADELAAVSDFAAKPNWRTLQGPLIYAFTDPGELNRGEDYFDDVSTDMTTETKAAAVIEALDQTATALDEAFGSSRKDDWRWGEIHTVTFTSLFSAAGVDIYDNGPYVNDGGFYTVDVANPRGVDGDYSHPNGPSIRVVFEAQQGGGIEGWFQLPGGQDNHRDSEFYGSLIDDWLTNTPRKLLFDRQEVDEAAVETIQAGPAE